MAPLTLILLIVSGVAIISLPRKWALATMIGAITLIPMSAIAIGPASFYPARIIIVFGTIRVITRGEKINGPLNKVDQTVILWSLAMILTRVLVTRTDISIIARFGETYDVTGIYFLFRCLISDKEDVFFVFKTVAVVFCVMMTAMFYERIKYFNLFSKLGGVSPFPSIRDGKIRCQGPFLHSILAGNVAGTSIPWFIAMCFSKGALQKFAYAGFISGVLVVVLTASSGPVMSAFLAIVACCAWPLRKNMKNIRWGILFTLIILHFTMQSPVWFLIAKIDLTGSSTGWHRAELIDTAIRHFNEWWVVGTDYTRHWMPTGVTWSDQHTDITNQYIKNGINGGIITMILFIMLIVHGFSILGKTLASVSVECFFEKILLWSLGATLFSHTITFLSVRYFDQSFSYFFLLLAMIGSLHHFYKVNHKTIEFKKNAI